MYGTWHPDRGHAENIPPEDIVERLEANVRTKIALSQRADSEFVNAYNKMVKESGHRDAFRMLEAFHSTNTLALLREYALRTHPFEIIQSEAIITYVNIAGTNAIPFLREVMASENLTATNRLELSPHLEKTVTNLTEKARPAEVAAFSAFLPELRQPKEEPR